MSSLDCYRTCSPSTSNLFSFFLFSSCRDNLFLHCLIVPFSLLPTYSLLLYYPFTPFFPTTHLLAFHPTHTSHLNLQTRPLLPTSLPGLLHFLFFYSSLFPQSSLCHVILVHFPLPSLFLNALMNPSHLFSSISPSSPLFLSPTIRS